MFQGSDQIGYLGDQLTIWGPRVLVAILILVVTHFIAKALRWAVIKLVEKIPLWSRDTARPGHDLAVSLGTLAYWVVWLVGLIVALQPLNLTQAIEPVNALTQEVFVYLPRIIGAGFILFAGILIARIVRTIVETALGAMQLDRLCAKMGRTAGLAGRDPAGDPRTTGAPAVPTAPGAPAAAATAPAAAPRDCSALIRMVGALVFTVIIIPVAIAALETLGIASIVEPTVLVLQTVLDALPRIFAAALLLAIAYFIAQWVRSLLEQVLVSMGFDRALTSLGGMAEGGGRPSRVAGWIALVAIMLFAAIEAASLLQFDVVAIMLAQATELGAQVVFGSVIVVVGVIMARLVARLVGTSVGESGLPSLLKYAIIALAVAMGLRFMGLANEIVNLAFGLILGSAAVACALAFGLGGRETAHQLLQKWVARKKPGLDTRDTP